MANVHRYYYTVLVLQQAALLITQFWNTEAYQSLKQIYKQFIEVNVKQSKWRNGENG